MDLPLLRKLQAMKRIEDDRSLRFRAETCDLASLRPKYPKVIIVDQIYDNPTLIMAPMARGRLTAASSEGPVMVQLITNSLSQAVMEIYKFELEAGGHGLSPPGWSIILKEGLYIDPFISFSDNDLQIEIVGLKDVRLLFMGDSSQQPGLLTWSQLTLNNIRIYDLRDSDNTCVFAHGALVAFNTVLVHAPHTEAFVIAGASSVILKDCALVGCQVAIELADSSRLSIDDSIVKDISYVCVYCLKDSSFTAVKSRFFNHNQFLVCQKSRCRIDRCRFLHDAISEGVHKVEFLVTGGAKNFVLALKLKNHTCYGSYVLKFVPEYLS